MGNILKINCKELYKSGVYINSQIKALDDAVIQMKQINNEIKEAWDGSDYDTFYSNFDEYLSSIKDLEYSLVDQVSVMKSVAIKHGRVDKNLYDNLNRGLKNER